MEKRHSEVRDFISFYYTMCSFPRVNHTEGVNILDVFVKHTYQTEQKGSFTKPICKTHYKV